MIYRSIKSTLFVFALGLVSIGASNADVRPTHDSLVSETATPFAPTAIDGRVYATEVDGDIVYVGGSFTQIQQQLNGAVINQPYLFAYRKSTGDIITSFRPTLDNEVRALQTSGGTGIFVGGAFRFVNGDRKLGLVKLDLNGNRIPQFNVNVNKRVYSLDRTGNTLYAGGNFTKISGTNVEFFAAMDVTTGAVKSNVSLNFDGVISTNRTNGSGKVDDIEITSDGKIAVLVGNFISINGLNRMRLAVIELGPQQAIVSDWNTNVFDVQCPASLFPQYIRAIDISPDDSYFVTGTTGFRRVKEPACDSIIRWDFGNLSDGNAQPTWVNWTGGDSVYEVAISDHAIYTGGHFRWLNNDRSSDGRTAGPGSVDRAGMAALDPKNGLTLLNWRSDRNPRGRGTFSLELEPEGLYIGDDTDFLNGSYTGRVKLLPISNNVISRPSEITLPTNLININSNQLRTQSFNGGANIGSASNVAGGYSNIRGMMLVGNQLYYGLNNGTMASRPVGNGNVGTPTSVNLRGLSPRYFDVSDITGMYFDYDQGRVYYTLLNRNDLYWRHFTPDNPIFGEYENVANVNTNIPWSGVRGMDVVDGKLYFGYNNGNLYSINVNGFVPAGNARLVANSNMFNVRALTFGAINGNTAPPPPTTETINFSSAGTPNNKRWQVFRFEVEAGQMITANVNWNSGAKVRVFLRDDNNSQIDRDINGVTDAEVFAIAQTTGRYSLGIAVVEGNASYDIEVVLEN